MKFLNNVLLCTSSILFIKGINTLSTECAEEAAKYRDCLDILDYDSLELDTKQSVVNFCSLFNDAKCNAFVSDINKTTTTCYADDTTDVSDLSTGEPVIRMKIAYMLFCAKGETGNTCPASTFIQEAFADAENFSLYTIEDHLEPFTGDCTDEACKTRMVNLKDVADLYDKILNSLYDEGDAVSVLDEPILKLYNEKFYSIYKNGQCDAIKNITYDPPPEPVKPTTVKPTATPTSSPPDSSTPDSSTPDSSSSSSSSSSIADDNKNADKDKEDEDKDSGALSLYKITYSFIAIIVLTAMLLI